MAARLLGTYAVEKPWGRTELPPPFQSDGSVKIGEIWFADDSSAPLPLLAKYLFTSEKLSIQVHPDDDQAHARGLPSGKSECWLVLDAAPDAVLGIGTRRPLDADALRAAALDGSIEALIDWKPVARGDFFYIPAGTIHAIGPGVSLIEVQQQADVTYRLYDYARPRALHLDDAVAVSRAQPYADPCATRVDFAEDKQLLDGPIFRVAIGGGEMRLDGHGTTLVLPLSGSVTAGGVTARAGDCLAVEDGSSWTASDEARMVLARMV